jgi:hypothetical protein
MKKLLITESEKMHILNMHKSNIQKKYLTEKTMEPEPVRTNNSYYIRFAFDEGKYSINKDTRKKLVDAIVKVMRPSMGTIKTFIDSKYPLPIMAKITVGTSHTGTPKQNAAVATARENVLKSILTEAFTQIGVREDKIKQILNFVSGEYKPTKFDYSFYDATKVNPDDSERFGKLELFPITTMGLDKKALNVASSKINSPDVTKSKTVNNPESFSNLWGLLDPGTTTEYYTEPDQESISKGVSMLKTYSDVQDLNDQLESIRRIGVADIINNKITDRAKFIQACATIKKAFERSGKAPSLVDCRSVGDLNIEFE